MGWLNTSWKYRKKITVPASNINSDLTDFPVSIKLNDFPQDFWLNVLNGGADIRVTKSDGTTEVPREVVTCNTSAKTGQLHFKAAGTLSSSVDNDFYIYYGNSGASEPAVTDTYGRNNVWTSYKRVFHLGQDPSASAPQFIDSTGSGYDLSSNGSMTSGDLVAGQLGNGIDFDGSNDYLSGSDTGLPAGTAARTATMWIKHNSADGTSWDGFCGYGTKSTKQAWYPSFYSTTRQTLLATNGGDTAATTFTLTDNAWNYLAVKSSGTSVKLIKNGTTSETKTMPTSYSTVLAGSTGFQIGWNWNTQYYGGVIDEVRIAASELSDDWISAEYVNQNTPDTFYSIGITEHETPQSNWYNVSWDARVQLSIDKSKIATDVTNFPIYVDLSLLPAGFFTHVKTDGADIRVTLGDGVTELACEVVNISTGGQTGEIHTKHPLLKTAGGGDSIFIYCGNSGASLPAVTDTYGRNAVWSDYKAVYHCDQDPSGSAPQIIDSTGNGNNLTSNGSMTSGDLVAAKIGNGLDFDGINDYLQGSDAASLEVSAVSIQGWFRLNTEGGNSNLFGRDGGGNSPYKFRMSGTGAINFQIRNTSLSWVNSPNLSIGSDILSDNSTWYMLHGTYSSSDANRIYKNGSEHGNTAANLGIITSSTQGIEVARSGADGTYMGMRADELRIRGAVLAPGWITTEYNNQNSVGTFFSAVSSLATGDTPPEISSTSPVDNATGISIGANLSITFSENVTAGTGYITIKKTSDNTTFEAIDVTSGQVTIVDDTVTINPGSNLAYSTEYYVLIDNTAFVDSGSNAFAGISSTTEWSFTTEAPDVTAPTLSSSTPTDGATGVTASANIVLTFSETISKGTGYITIKKYNDDTTIEAIDVTSGQVTIVDDEVTINPSSNLPNATHVYVLIDNTCFKDASDNYYAGIASKTTLDFTVADTVAPSLVSSIPEAGAPAVEPNTTITLTFDENVVAGTGNITIKEYVGDATFEAIDVTSGQVVITSNQAVITPGSNLDPNTKYYILIANTAFTDAASNAYLGISDKDDLSFTTIPVVTQSLTPANSAVDVDPASNLELQFNQNVSANTGNITISKIPSLLIGGDDFAGDIGEILVINDGITTEDRQKIEGYLAWRWFNASNPLISSHPFKYKGPTI